MSALKNTTRHNIPLDRALQAVAAKGEIPVNLNNFLDNHHYVTIPVLTTVIICIRLAAIVAAIIIKQVRAKARAVRQTVNYQNQALIIMQETLRNLEHNRDEYENRPRKQQAPQPPPTAWLASLTMTEKPPRVPPPYATTLPQGQPGYSLGASPSLAADMLRTAATTAGQSLGMPHGLVANMLGTPAATAGHYLGMQHKLAANMLRLQTGRDQAPVMNFPIATPTSIDMKTMMACQ
jgi:hypothetical protein